MMVKEQTPIEYTDIQEQFLDLLKKYPIKKPETIVDYVSSQGEGILEDPAKLAVALAECEITPVRRRQALKHWFADKGVAVPDELLHKVGLPPDRSKEEEQRKAAEEEARRAKYSVDEDSGTIKVATTGEKGLTLPEAEKLSKHIKKERTETGKVPAPTYVYDAEASQVRMARVDERGGTLEQAKELKKMAQESAKGATEQPFMIGEDGKWGVNPNAKLTTMELLTWSAIQKSQEKGEVVEPLEAMAQAAERLKSFRDLFGERQQTAEWMSDPAKFVEMINTITGGGKADEGLKSKVDQLTDAIASMKDERYQAQIATAQSQILQLAKKIEEMTDLSKRSLTGRNEMDIIHDVATKGIDAFKTELSGIRSDLRAMMSSTGLPPGKSPQQRGERRVRLQEGLATDAEIEALGKHLFLAAGVEQ